MAWKPSRAPSLSSSPHIPVSAIPRIRNSLSPLPSKPSKNSRNNYLRQKLLKTLPKLQPSTVPIQTPQNPNPREDTSQKPTNPFIQEAKVVLEEEEQQQQEEEGENEVKEMAFSHSPALPSAFGFDSPKSFANLVLCFLGMFVFQTVCTVWILGSADVAKISENSTETKDGEKNSDLGLYSDGLEVEKRVSEIRVLAREARVNEQKKSRSGALASSATVGDDGDEFIVETATSRVRTDVRKEVDRRVLKLKESIRDSRHENSPKPANSMDKGGNLAFRKRQAVRISSLKSRNDPKGFGGINRNDSLSIRGESGENGLLNQEVRREDVLDSNAIEEEDSRWLNDGILRRIVLKVRANEEAGKELYSGLASVEEMNFFVALQRKLDREGVDDVKQWMEKKIEDAYNYNGVTQKNGNGKPLEEFMRPYDTAKPIIERSIRDIAVKLMERSKSGHGHGTSIRNFEKEFQNTSSTAENSFQGQNYASKVFEETSNQNEGHLNESRSRDFGTKISRRSKNVNQGTPSTSGKKILSSSSGSSNSQLQTRKVKLSGPYKAEDSGSDNESHLWWLDLPYVLAIFLRRGFEKDGQRGLYSLKKNSHSGNGSCPSYTIAFENQGDATNFCFLLNSFFEDLGDFSAEVVPLSVKELQEGVKSRDMKVIVIRRGQLQLYAGQPLEDVEMSIRLIFE